MPRILDTLWPEFVDATTPGTGTKLDAVLFGDVKDAIAAAVYNPDLSEDPPGIAAEVVDARANYPNLDGRFDAVEAAAAGGLASSAAVGAQVNLVPNDTFGIWAAGVSVAPTFWAAEAALTVTRESSLTGGTSPPGAYFGRASVKLVASTQKDFYIDIISAAEIGTLVTPKLLKSRPVAAGVEIYTTSSNLVEVHIDDGVTSIGASTLVGGNYNTTSAWIWSATGHADLGGLTLPSTPTHLRLIIRLTGAGTAWVSCPAFYFAPSASSYVPTSCKIGTILWGVDSSAAIATGAKMQLYPPNPIALIDARLLLTTAAATAVIAEVYKDGAAIFGGLITTGASADSGVKTPATVTLASFATTNLLKVSLTSADSTARGPTLSVRYIEYLRNLNSGFVGA